MTAQMNEKKKEGFVPCVFVSIIKFYSLFTFSIFLISKTVNYNDTYNIERDWQWHGRTKGVS